MTSEFLESLKSENAAMAEEIERLSQKGTKVLVQEETKAPRHQSDERAIRVIDFGCGTCAGHAGEDNGGGDRPPQCSRRTNLGGFFTS